MLSKLSGVLFEQRRVPLFSPPTLPCPGLGSCPGTSFSFYWVSGLSVMGATVGLGAGSLVA